MTRQAEYESKCPNVKPDPVEIYTWVYCQFIKFDSYQNPGVSPPDGDQNFLAKILDQTA